MPHSADCPEGRSQHFTLPRRDFLQKTALAALPFIFLRPQPTAASPSSQPDTATPLSKYPLPQFNIGDLVAQDWEPNDDDAPEFATDFGEILGMRWIPEPDSYCSIANTWVYYIRWTHSSCPGCLPEPYCDGELTLAADLRLVNHA
ncbi:hypothetical protein [Microcoleus sp. B3-D7]|uniref:hypothetical protein n=1 Tax=Microcoleus sp. B3-D7 TaxID=2818659 RepID=UPI002FCF0B98